MAHPRNSLVAAASAAMLATSAFAAPVITQSSNALALAQAITGGNVTLLGATLQGAAQQSGTFANGTSSVGFASGVVLSTGNVKAIPGANANGGSESLGSGVDAGSGQISTETGAAGYAPLASLGGTTSFDTSVLTITFQFGDGTVGGDLGVRYVFASDEFINYTNSKYNDVFAFFLDGVNIALLPGTNTPVSTNSVNPTANSGRYINNVRNTNGYPVAGRDFQFDGLTQILTASASNLGTGTHTMSFAIADIADRKLDSAVFLQAGSFSTDTKAEPLPEPGSVVLMSAALLGLAAARRKGLRRC